MADFFMLRRGREESSFMTLEHLGNSKMDSLSFLICSVEGILRLL